MKVTKREFTHLLEKVLEQAAKNAEEQLKIDVPRSFMVQKLWGNWLDTTIHLIKLEEAIDELYLDEEQFYLVIDVGLKAINKRSNQTTVTIRPSGHKPGPFEKTWNKPIGMGPFKLIFWKDIKVIT